MAYRHGVYTSQQATSVNTPVVATSGIPFVVGTAPAHSVEGGTVDKLILANTYEEAVKALGYSDDWETYTLCEMIYSHFKLYQCAPVIFVNILDKEKDKKAAETKEFEIVSGKATLPIDYLAETVKVSSAESGGTTYTKTEDYNLFYDGDALILEVAEGGAIKENKVYISGDVIDKAKVTKTKVIGGINAQDGTASGFELVENCFAAFGIVPDLLLAPGFSHDSEVAAVMQAKCTGINELFKAKALIDADCKEVTDYKKVPAWKNENNITDAAQVVYWPMVTMGDKKYHMSVHMAGVIAQTDNENDGCPSESPSNKTMQIDGLCTADGVEVLLNVTQANFLNSNGVATAINFVGGFKSWGNETAAYPAETDVKDYFLCVSRTFAWAEKTAVQTFWNKLDKKMTRRLIDNIVDTFNMWLNGITSEEKILGGRIEFSEAENPEINLMAGKAKFHIYLTPPSPAKELDFVFEYDVNYIETALQG